MTCATFGQTWSETLCSMDSDGDGRSNGEELGDPDCVWTEDDELPSEIEGLSHPGKIIYNMYTSRTCTGASTHRSA